MGTGGGRVVSRRKRWPVLVQPVHLPAPPRQLAAAPPAAAAPRAPGQVSQRQLDERVAQGLEVVAQARALRAQHRAGGKVGRAHKVAARPRALGVEAAQGVRRGGVGGCWATRAAQQQQPALGLPPCASVPARVPARVPAARPALCWAAAHRSVKPKSTRKTWGLPAAVPGAAAAAAPALEPSAAGSAAITKLAGLTSLCTKPWGRGGGAGAGAVGRRGEPPAGFWHTLRALER